MKIIVTLMTLSISAGVFAQAFNWEDQTAGTYVGPYSMTEGGNTATINAIGASSPLIYIANPGVPLLGTLSGAAFSGSVVYGDNTGQMWSFAHSLSSVTFAYGDYGGDTDDYVTINAYDASNNLIGSQTKYYGYSGAGDTMSFNSLVGMASFTCNSGGPAPGSLFFEVTNSAMATPEPAPFLALGLGALVLRRRKK